MSAVGQWFHEMQEDAEFCLYTYVDPGYALAEFLKRHPGQADFFDRRRTEIDGDGYQNYEPERN